MSDVVDQFLSERKNGKIKDKVKPDLDESEKQKILYDLDEQFSSAKWISDAAKRACQLSMVSHPSKFSHPDAKTSSIISQNSKSNDGYLRSGNADYELDVFGNAAALDVYKFLNLKLDDGDTILSHLERDSAEIRSIFAASEASYEELKNGFLSMKQIDSSKKTDRLVKQVYFPVNDAYHLLSILTPSGLVTRIKNQIDYIRFSDLSKEAKETRREKEFHPTGYDDIPDLVVIGYGGTKPQNISVLNSQNGGRSYLLPTIPPKFRKREVRLPTHDFFKNSLWIGSFKESFRFLDKLIRDKRNNMDIRQQMAKTLGYLIDDVMQIAFKIRSHESGWSNAEHYKSLPLAQRIWLDEVHSEQRESNEDWIDEVAKNFTRWIIYSYQTLFKETHEKLGDAEFMRICSIVESVISEDKNVLNREVLR